MVGLCVVLLVTGLSSKEKVDQPPLLMHDILIMVIVHSEIMQVPLSVFYFSYHQSFLYQLYTIADLSSILNNVPLLVGVSL
jgi:hypothetical protein